MPEYAIEVKNLCINYKGLKSYSIKDNLFRGRKGNTEVVEAVKNVSFQVEKGDIVGIVGKNGSGKSTMLRAIAGIFSPNSGTVDLHGNTVSLLSIGVGFQRELSGRENILLSGMLLGFSESQIRKRMDEIIEFSELGKFIDAPVKTYSSGMYSKLAFSITAILETDIILIDEVLSVGDVRFKRKSYNKMKQLITDKDRTVIIVSHEKKTITDLCNKVLWINEGNLVRYGDTEEVFNMYEKYMLRQDPDANVGMVTFRVTPSEAHRSYQWEYRNSEFDSWETCSMPGSKTPVLKLRKLKKRDGHQYRCVITDVDGTVHYSGTGTMKS